MSIKSVLITGTSSGIGKASVSLFTNAGIMVHGFDIKPASVTHPLFKHYDIDVTQPDTFPDLDVDAIVNNAGVVDEETSIAVNQQGYINIIAKYGYSPVIKSILNVASISGHVGLDTPAYASSQGGRLAYTKHLAIQLGQEYGTRVNSLSPGATLTGLEPYDEHKDLVELVAKESLLNKWATAEDIAQGIYFITCVDKSMTGQDIIVDNGEVAKRNFIKIG